MKEADFQRQVVYLAELRNWLVYHTYDSRRSQPGFPDLVLVRSDKVIYAELKSETGHVSAVQQQWIDALRHAGQLVYLWRPADWDEIALVLR